MVLILSGRNIGYLPDHVAAPHVAAGTLRALRPDLTRLVTEVAAITGPSSNDFKLARRFVDCLIDTHMEANGGATISQLANLSTEDAERGDPAGEAGVAATTIRRHAKA
jgi:hypothetical protein